MTTEDPEIDRLIGRCLSLDDDLELQIAKVDRLIERLRKLR